MTDEQTGNSGGAIKSKTGLPVLILLDASTAISDLNFDGKKSDDVKLWVLNRIPIYYSDDGANWIRGYGDFEGCLAKPKAIEIKGKKRREHIPLKEGQIRIHFTTVIPKDADKDKRCNAYCNTQLKLEGPEKDYMRPYPEEFSKEEEKQFNFGLFSNGIRVLKIPSDKVKYPFDIGQLAYWQRQVYKLSLDKKIGAYRHMELSGTLTTPIVKDELKPLLRKKLGRFQAEFLYHSDEKSIMPPAVLLLPIEYGEHCFMYGVDKDVMQSQGSGEDPAEKQGQGAQQVPGSKPVQKEEFDQKVAGKAYLFRMDKPDKGYKPTKTRPIHDDFKNLNYRSTCFNLFAELRKDETLGDSSLYDTNPLIYPYPDVLTPPETQKKQIVSLINENKKLKNKKAHEVAELINKKVDKVVTDKIIRGAFIVSIGDSLEICILLALNQVLANAESFIKTEGVDLMTMPDGNKYHYTIKRVFFATGSDSFSDDVVPRHIYFQLDSWWGGLQDFQKDEIRDSDEIDILGFSSRLGDETTPEDNERLKKDRAWKTAMCLQYLLKKVGIKSSGPLSQDSSKDTIKINHRAAAKSAFPDKKVFNKYERSFVQNVIDPGKMEVIESRNITDNNPDDRVAWIIFKRPKKEFAQIVRSTAVTNNAMPIHKYKTILYLKSNSREVKVRRDGKIVKVTRGREEDIALVYVCPGAFDDA